MERFITGGRQKVVGVASYQPQLVEAAGGKGPDGTVIKEAVVYLQREPSNPHDHNAVRVHVSGKTIGYIPRNETYKYTPALSGGMVAAYAKFIGGWKRGNGNEGHIGVELDIKQPPSLV